MNPKISGHRRCRTLTLISSAISSAALAPLAAAQEDPAADSHHGIEEIIVSATPLARTVQQLAQPSAVLSGDDLALKQSASIGETLSGEVGLSSSYFGPVSSRPVIRGQYGERVRVLSNGLDAMDASALSEDHQVSVEGVLAERVEIVRGPATLLYGSGAAGGLVNVVDNRIRETSLEEPLSGAIALQGESAVGSRSGAGRVAFGTPDLAIHLDYFRRETDDVEIPGFAESAILRALEEEEEHEGHEEHDEEEHAYGVVENTDSETDGGALGVSWTGERGFAGVSFSTFNSKYGIPGHHHDEEEDDDDHDPDHELEEAGEEDVRVDLEQRRFDFRGEYQLDRAIELVKLRVARSEYEHRELHGDEVGTLFDSTGTDARLEMRHAPVGSLEGAFGLQFKRTDFDAMGDEAFVPPSDTRQTSLFLFEEYALNDRWTLQASARAERQSISSSAFSQEYRDTAYGASVGAIWSFTDGMSLAMNYALTERHPNSTELFADGAHLAADRVEHGSVVLGQGFLGKETSGNLDVTWRGRYDRLEWTLTGFINDVDDYILLSPTGETEGELAVFEYAQADVELYGFEAEARVELLDTASQHLHARVFSDYVHAEEKDSGAYLPRIPALRYGAGAHYTRDRFSASVEASFRSRQSKTAVHELPTDDHVLLSADVSYALEDLGLFLFLRGTNLLDEDARLHTSPLKDTVPLPGRSVHVGLRYEF